jgi:anaerobic magnesium-protoporphyrin IX monomethyl ester cyclase
LAHDSDVPASLDQPLESTSLKKGTRLLFIVPMHITWESYLHPAENSRSYIKKDGHRYNSLATDLPLGPLSMSAYIKKYYDDIDIKLIDFNAELNVLDSITAETYTDLVRFFLNRFAEFDPTIIGISSLFSPSFDNFMDSARTARELFPNALILGGGNIPTNSYEYIYKELGETSFDGLCIGEGEKPLLKLIQSVDRRLYIEQSRSWVSLDKLSRDLEYSPSHDFVEDLDEIPFFDYDLCDFDKHATNFNAHTSLHSAAKERLEQSQRSFHVMTSRGCPFLCTFCASHKTHGRSMRYHSLERVRSDISKLINSYGAGTIVFQDDHLMADRTRVEAILDMIKEFGVESLYQNGLTLYALDREMLHKFYDAGVRHLVLPVESGSEKVLKHQMRKPLKIRISERVADDCRALGIYTNTNILIGMPGETKEDLEEGRRNLKKIKTNWFNVVCASPVVGSEMHEVASRNGYIDIQNLGADYRTATISTDDFSAEYIQEFQYRLNLELNFVGNHDIASGEYSTALIGFDNVIRLRPDHAFAHYFRAAALIGLREVQAAGVSFSRYLELRNTNSKWRGYAEHFKLKDTFAELQSQEFSPPTSKLFNRIKEKAESIF